MTPWRKLFVRKKYVVAGLQIWRGGFAAWPEVVIPAFAAVLRAVKTLFAAWLQVVKTLFAAWPEVVIPAFAAVLRAVKTLFAAWLQAVMTEFVEIGRAHV